MKIIIVTGLSGSGKTAVIKALEDIDYFCIDNMIPDLIPPFLDFTRKLNTNIKKVALGIDCRGRESFSNLINVINQTSSNDIKYEILFMDCKDDVLIKRYKENRRNHPLSADGRIIDGIKKERKLLEDIKNMAKYTIDTSNINPKKLKEKIVGMFNKNINKNLIINVLSFGFKHGVPSDADFVFDVRFIDNPYYVAELKNKTGEDQEVFDFVMKPDISNQFVKSFENMMLPLLPNFVKEGRSQLVIAIGCTGGKHRSVTIARVITDLLKKNNYNVVLYHREIE